MWTKCVGEIKDSVDSFTVQTLMKMDPTEIGLETVKTWFWPIQEGDTRIFPGLDDKQTKTAYHQVIVYKDRQRRFRSLKSIAIDARVTLLRFYNVIEQIPIWFDKEAAKGYQGGGAITNRPRVETTLIGKFGVAGYAAIMCYVVANWDSMYETGKGVSCDEKSYTLRFKHSVWYELGKTIFLQWNMSPRFPNYIPDFQAVKEFKVISQNLIIIDLIT